MAARFVLALATLVPFMTIIEQDGRAFAQSPAQQRTATAKTTVPDISGSWAVVVTFPGRAGMPDGGFRATVTLKQHLLDPLKPGPLDGYFTYQNGNGGAFKGIVNDKKVTFTTVLKSSDRPGVTVFNDFIGTFDGENTIKGHMISVDTGPSTYMRGEGPFVATRRPSSARR
jgi:hypothetical protein